VRAVAPDWPGHGDSGKPAKGGGFDYSEAAFIAALGAFVDKIDLQKPLTLVVQVRVGWGWGWGWGSGAGAAA
jgi:pimeloyl-ACP methyl ester carboxylesterase